MMNKNDSEMILVLLCHFGLEAVLKKEVRALGLQIAEVSDGEVKVLGTVRDIARLNFNIRTAERVMVELATFKATTFDELFENVKKIELEKYIPIDGEFPITKANQDKNSILHSSTAIQSIVKKAMAERLKQIYNVRVLEESGVRFPFRVKMNKNVVSIRLDTTGDSLHKRGYRIKAGEAPIEETLAAALVLLTSFDKDKILLDPFCGSGTILIEAAMIAANIPVSADRAFVSERWKNIFGDDIRKIWKDCRDEAMSKIRTDVLKDKEIKIFGSDIDPNMIRIAKENAARAGVLDMMSFKTLPVKDVHSVGKVEAIKMIITNPPYGERMEDKESVVSIYKDLKNTYDNLKNFDMHIITSFEDAEKYLGKSSKNRKLYNGKIKTYFYSYNKV